MTEEKSAEFVDAGGVVEQPMGYPTPDYHAPEQDGAVQDGAVQDGAVQDGAVQDGAVQDGAVQDGAEFDDVDLYDAGPDDHAETIEFGAPDDTLVGLFCTFRIGRRHSDRFPMEVLNVATRPDPGGPSEVGDRPAVVLRVAQGALSDMLETHLGVCHEARGQAMPADKRAQLLDRLDRAYGTRLTGGEHCVVVYLWRAPPDPDGVGVRD
jgi:hypothetical protein